MYSNPEDIDLDIIEQLAKTMRDNDFNLLPVYKQLFTSQYFFSEANIGVQIKSPIEFIFGMQRIFGKSLQNSLTALSDLEQVIYQPPNVSGWTGYRTWISTTTYPYRVSYAVNLAEGLKNQDIVNIIDQVFNKQNPTEFLRELFLMFFPKDLEQEYYNRYMWFLLKEPITAENWTENVVNKSDDLINNVKDALVEIVKSPLFQLC